jgi:hypothetical protein
MTNKMWVPDWLLDLFTKITRKNKLQTLGVSEEYDYLDYSAMYFKRDPSVLQRNITPPSQGQSVS